MRSLRGLSDLCFTVVGRLWAHPHREEAEQQEELRTVTVVFQKGQGRQNTCFLTAVSCVYFVSSWRTPKENCINLESLMFYGGSELSRKKN